LSVSQKRFGPVTASQVGLKMLANCLENAP